MSTAKKHNLLFFGHNLPKPRALRNAGLKRQTLVGKLVFSGKLRKVSKPVPTFSGIYIALYPDAQSALQHFVADFARLLI